jgi:hypothetical protein
MMIIVGQGCQFGTMGHEGHKWQTPTTVDYVSTLALELVFEILWIELPLILEAV